MERDHIIRYNYVDFYRDFDYSNDYVSTLLKKHGIAGEISDSPDYIIHYPYFMNQYLNYDCIRIFWTGECVSPDFNLVDYAVGFDYLEYGDRYLRYPLWMDYKEDLERAKKKHEQDFSAAGQRDFCSFVYSNADGAPERQRFYELLSDYKKVSSGGSFLNNTGERVKDKNAFQSKHKFSIAFENASYPGYTTEKLLQAFAAGTVPIYWGDPMAVKDFNSEAFINCHDYKSLDEVVEAVKKIDRDDTMLRRYLCEPAFTESQLKAISVKREELERFFLHIFEQPYEEAFRRNRGYWGNLYEKEQKFLLLEMTGDHISFKSLGYVMKCLIKNTKRKLKKAGMDK